MSIEVTSLATLNSENVQEKMLVLSRMMQEQFPELDLTGGALHDIVLYLFSVLYTKTSTELERYKASQSLLAIEKDPTLADTDVVDNVMSNYNVVRKDETCATGKVTVVSSDDLSTIIPAGMIFTHDQNQFISRDGVVISDSESERTPRFTKLSNGKFGYTLDVVAVEPGSINPVSKGDAFEFDLYNIESVYAASDFIDGNSEETNASLISRLAEGMATPCWGNRYNILSLLRSKCPFVVGASVIGYGDSEMIRDKTSIFPIAVGGCTDIYIKSKYEEKSYPVVATCIGRSGINDVWQCTIPADAHPGCWRASYAALDDGREYQVTSQFVISGIEGTSSQVLSLQFETDDLFVYAGKTEGTKEFKISLKGQQDFGAVSNVFEDRDLIPVSSDVRVITARPAWVTVTLKLSEYIQNQEEVMNAVSEYIASTRFDGKLPSSEILRVALPLLDTAKILETHLSLEVWGFDNRIYRAVSSQVLTIPDDPLNGVTSRTTVFYCDAVNIEYEV